MITAQDLRDVKEGEMLVGDGIFFTVLEKLEPEGGQPVVRVKTPFIGSKRITTRTLCGRTFIVDCETTEPVGLDSPDAYIEEAMES